MRIAIVGGTGSFGRGLAARLRDLGHDVAIGWRRLLFPECPTSVNDKEFIAEIVQDFPSSIGWEAERNGAFRIDFKNDDWVVGV